MPKKLRKTIENPPTLAKFQAWVDQVNQGFKLPYRLDQAEKILERHAKRLGVPWPPCCVQLPDVKGVKGRKRDKIKRQLKEQFSIRPGKKVRFGDPGTEEETLIEAAFRLAAVRDQMEKGNLETTAVHCLFLGGAVERLRTSAGASRAAKRRSTTREWDDPIGDLDRAYQKYRESGRTEKPQAGDFQRGLDALGLKAPVSDSTFAKRVSEWRKLRSDRQ